MMRFYLGEELINFDEHELEKQTERPWYNDLRPEFYTVFDRTLENLFEIQDDKREYLDHGIRNTYNQLYIMESSIELIKLFESKLKIDDGTHILSYEEDGRKFNKDEMKSVKEEWEKGLKLLQDYRESRFSYKYPLERLEMDCSEHLRRLTQNCIEKAGVRPEEIEAQVRGIMNGLYGS